jgi:hypothetical protein
MTMLERVARAIDRDLWQSIDRFVEYAAVPHGEMHKAAIASLTAPSLTRARVAIGAMWGPDEAMLSGARDWSIGKNGQGVGNDQATGCWQAMIDAALRVKSP